VHLRSPRLVTLSIGVGPQHHNPTPAARRNRRKKFIRAGRRLRLPRGRLRTGSYCHACVSQTQAMAAIGLFLAAFFPI
jgi:hypothetical protein